jgi:hypothetical protein
VITLNVRVKKRGERSQVVKAVDCGSTTRGFESPRSPLFDTFYFLGVNLAGGRLQS